MKNKNLIGTFSLNSCPNITEIMSKNLDYIIIIESMEHIASAKLTFLTKLSKKIVYHLLDAAI